MAARRRVRTGRSDLTQFVDSYIETALWSSNDESNESGGEPLDKNYGPSDLAPETRRTMFLDAASFYKANLMDFDDPGQAGHDFWLTRNEHGAGFWDGDYPEPQASRLTAASEDYGGFNLYVGDDSQIYGDTHRGRPSRKARDTYRGRSSRKVRDPQEFEKRRENIEGLDVTFTHYPRTKMWQATIHAKTGSGTLPGPSGRTYQQAVDRTRALLRKSRSQQTGFGLLTGQRKPYGSQRRSNGNR